MREISVVLIFNLVVRQIQRVQVVEDHAHGQLGIWGDFELVILFRGVVNQVVAFLQGDEQVAIIGEIELDVGEVVASQVECLDRLFVGADVLMNLHRSAPGVVDEAIFVDAHRELPRVDEVG